MATKEERDVAFIESGSDEERLNEHDRAFEKRVLRKVDRRLLPILGALYCIALVDRNNISVARISGLDEDLALDIGNRASIALLVFFVGYVIFEIPSNIVIRRVGPAIWLSAIALAWGAVSLGIGFLQTWWELAILRAILGVLEAGYYPGCVYLIATWYKRYELQKRLSLFFVFATSVSGFANIFALGLIQISKVTSYKGWRWIYIIEGGITMAVAVLAYFIVVDFPNSHRNKFLSAEEKAFVVARLVKDRGGDEHAEKVTWRVVWTTALDWRVWSFSFMYFAGAAGIYAFGLFLPIILRNGLGFSQELAFLLAAFPPVFAALEVMVLSWWSDKIRKRGVFVIGQGLLGIFGLCLTAFLNNSVGRYIGTFLGYAGAVGLVVGPLAWLANNVRSDGKRSVASAMAIMMSGISGIYSSLVFRQQDAPDYLPGIIAVIAVNVLGVSLAAVTVIVLKLENRKADRGEKVLEGLPEFRYTL
ncbi:MFS transporter prlL, partial [Pseudocercospora fuligena]